MSVVRVDEHTVAVIGELDAATAPQVSSVVEDRAVQRVDVSGVAFIDVAGLRALLCRDELVLYSPSRPVRRLLELCEVAGVPVRGPR